VKEIETGNESNLLLQRIFESTNDAKRCVAGINHSPKRRLPAVVQQMAGWLELLHVTTENLL